VDDGEIYPLLRPPHLFNRAPRGAAKAAGYCSESKLRGRKGLRQLDLFRVDLKIPFPSKPLPNSFVLFKEGGYLAAMMFRPEKCWRGQSSPASKTI